MNEEINKIRSEIDTLDNIIVDALVKRTNCVLEIVKYKTNEEEVRGCDRVKIVLDKVRNKAIQAGGHDEIVVEVYKKIIEVLNRYAVGDSQEASRITTRPGGLVA